MFYRKLKKIKDDQKRLEFIHIDGIIEREFNSNSRGVIICAAIAVSALFISFTLLLIAGYIIEMIITLFGMIILAIMLNIKIKKIQKEKERHIENVYDLYDI